ncbi:Uma2 family endonuclease [Streptomyces sp. NBS 14/10]|uniref:Uma2 family endonuclease n=1 Tax=Streptomyces sp. NBS 14/10 TaxID=1945643 RepID=UPI000B7E08B1|nr:Uma2 family endonuclease [Streptomyces sp. NBS 14/10]KAK1179488.1 Uma2 family endonuclease [Streptomyces sp. NBS 14/10]NUS83288.1 Uma2 family endonuclease [Streptomyces sp.]
MTVMTERTSHMLVEEFEEIAAAAPETVTLEFINGRIEEKRVPDGDHDEIVGWLQRRCMQQRPDLWLHAVQRGLKVEAYRKGRARPDGVLAPEGRFAGDGEWSDPDGVLMTVEVTSHDRDTEARDRIEKPAAYATAGIPVYLLVDRDACALIVHTTPDPKSGCYLDIHRAPFGEQVVLPEPVGITLDTDVLKNYVH